MKKLVSIIVLMLLITCNVSCFAADINVYKLKNGQTVVIEEIHNNPIVTVDTWVKTGSINENNINNGVAHFLEHLSFKGTTHYKAGDFERILDAKGAVYNAETSKDYTHFYITSASDYINTIIKLNADMLMNITIPEDQLAQERKVVIEEINRSLDNPGRILYNNLNSLLFKTHPYKYETIGTEQIISSIPRSEIMNFHKKWYIPSNMITVVVGDVNSQKVLNQLEKEFSAPKNPQKLVSSYTAEPNLNKSAEKITRGNYNTGYMMIGFKGVNYKNKKESYALDLASSILGDGTSSRLYQHIKEDKKLADSIDAGHMSMRDDSIFYVSANFDEKNLPALRSAIKDELNALAQKPVTEQELCRAKNMFKRSFEYANESTENIANQIGYVYTLGGNISDYKNYINEINKITAPEIQKAVQKYIKDDQMAVSIILPNTNTVGETPSADSSIKQVADIKPLKPDVHKNLKRYRLTNGMTLIIDKNTSNDIIGTSIYAKGGNFIEKKAGTSDLMASTLIRGTKNRTFKQLSLEMNSNGIIISPNASDDYFNIEMKSTKADYNKAFELISDIILNPTFNPADIDINKQDILQGIKQSRDRPQSIALEEFNIAMYPNHPYGRTGRIIESSIPTVTREDIIDYYNQIFTPQNMIIAVSGNVDEKDIIAKFSSLLNCKKGEKIDNTKLLNPYKPLDKNIEIKTPKDVATAWLVMGWPTDGMYNSKDYATLNIINGILGKGMSSRLFKDLREKQGLAYEVSSSYPIKLDKSYFLMYIGTNNQNLSHVKKGFLEEINTLKTQPVSKKELDEVKQKLLGYFILAQETNLDKASRLGWFELSDRGYDYADKYKTLINSVTAEDIINTANKYFNKPYIISVIGREEYLRKMEK